MRVLFCCNGSGAAEDAVRFGALIAAACRAETSILGIAERAAREDSLLHALRRAQALLREHQLDAELVTKTGRFLPELIQRTRQHRYDLVVIGTSPKGANGPWWMGSHACKTVEAIETPVLVVIGHRTSLRRILVATSGAPQAQAAVEFAGEIARNLDAAVTLFHVVPEPPPIYGDLIAREEDPERLLASHSKRGRTLRHQMDLMLQRGVRCEFRLRDGLVVPELLKESNQGDHDLVVIGASPGDDKLRESVMGDVTREFVDRAERPVLVVRGRSTAAPRRLRDRIRGWFGSPPAPA